MTDSDGSQKGMLSNGVKLTEQRCVPCEGGTMPLTIEESETLMKDVGGWTLSPDVKKISRHYTFKNFAEALAFTNKVGTLAEAEGHHPDLTLGWGKVGVELTTHAIGGLSVNDFILAAKIDVIP
ncbi:MAG: 4a-hydroxytetrahydrobiopterin dehydratase [Patescibacteria group bacterium]